MKRLKNYYKTNKSLKMYEIYKLIYLINEADDIVQTMIKLTNSLKYKS